MVAECVHMIERMSHQVVEPVGKNISRIPRHALLFSWLLLLLECCYNKKVWDGFGRKSYLGSVEVLQNSWTTDSVGSQVTTETPLSFRVCMGSFYPFLFPSSLFQALSNRARHFLGLISRSILPCSTVHLNTTSHLTFTLLEAQ